MSHLLETATRLSESGIAHVIIIKSHARALIVPYGETNFFTPAPGVRVLLQLESVLMYAKKASGKHAGQSAVFVR